MKILERNLDGRPSAIEWENDAEMVVSEIMELLLDQGHSQGEAMIMLRGALVHSDLRSPTPVLDRLLTPEVVDWLTE